MNKVETKVEALWHVNGSGFFSPEQKQKIASVFANRLTKDGMLIVTSSEDRTQLGNKAIATAKLIRLVNDSLIEEKVRKATRVPSGVRMRRKETKIRNSLLKQSRSRRSWQ